MCSDLPFASWKRTSLKDYVQAYPSDRCWLQHCRLLHTFLKGMFSEDLPSFWLEKKKFDTTALYT